MLAKNAGARSFRCEQSEQLKMYRFRHQRERFLNQLEARWEATLPCT
jgi:hypothetical protein